MKSTFEKLFVALIAVSGFAVLGYSGAHWRITDGVSFAALFVAALVASNLKLKLPGLTSSMSMNLPFFMLALVQTSPAEAVAIGCAGIFMQTAVRNLTMKPLQVLFNFCNTALSMFLAAQAAQYVSHISVGAGPATAAAALFLGHTVPVAIIIAISEGKGLGRIWSQIASLSFAYYLLAGGVVAMMQMMFVSGWHSSVVVLPLMLGVYASYSRYFGNEAAAKEKTMAPAGAAVAAASAS
jgi:hypothetical protein